MSIASVTEPKKRALKRPRDKNDAYDVPLPPAKRPKWSYNWAAYIRTLSPKQLRRYKKCIIENKRKWYRMQLARGHPPSIYMHAFLFGGIPRPPPRPATYTGPVLSHPYSPPLHGTRKVKVVWRRNGKIVTGTEVRTVDHDVHATASVDMDTNHQKKRAHDDTMLPDYDENETPEFLAPSAKRQKPPAQKEEVDTAPTRKRAPTQKNIIRRNQIQRKYRNSNPAGVSSWTVTPWVLPKPADTPIGRYIDEQIKRIRANLPKTTKPASKCGSEKNCNSDSESDSDESDSESDTVSDTDSSGISSGESDGEEEQVKGKKVMVPQQTTKQIPAVSKIVTPTSPLSGITPTSDIRKTPTPGSVGPPTTKKTFKVPCMPIQRLISLFQSKLSLATAESTATTEPAVKEAEPDCNPFKLHLKNPTMLKRTFVSHQCTRLHKGQIPKKKFTLTALQPATKCQFGAKGSRCLLPTIIDVTALQSVTKCLFGAKGSLPSTIDMVSKTGCGGTFVFCTEHG